MNPGKINRTTKASLAQSNCLKISCKPTARASIEYQMFREQSHLAHVSLMLSHILSLSSRTAARGRRPAQADPGPISQLAVGGEMGPGSCSPRAMARGLLGRDDTREIDPI